MAWSMKLVRPRPLHSVHITLPHPSHSGHGSAGICSAGTRKGLGEPSGRFALTPGVRLGGAIASGLSHRPDDGGD